MTTTPDSKDYPAEKLTQEVLRDALAYNPDTGTFIWKNPPARSRAKVGAPAGSLKGGYLLLSVCSESIFAHRAAWIYVNGSIEPGKVIDHINGERADNRIANLRLADAAQNGWNGRNRYEWTGVANGKYPGSYRATIRHRGKRYYLGMFKTREEAAAAYQKAAAELRGEFHGDDGKYPALPKPASEAGPFPRLFTAAQMYAYLDADRTQRTQESPASQDARDAARYRWLRQYPNTIRPEVYCPALDLLRRDEYLDAAIDAVLPTQQPPSPTDRVERAAGDAVSSRSGAAQDATRINGPGAKP